MAEYIIFLHDVLRHYKLVAIFTICRHHLDKLASLFYIFMSSQPIYTVDYHHISLSHKHVSQIAVNAQFILVIS